MAFIIDENANISMIQGDSGTLVIEGLNPDKNYTVYFAVQDKNRKPIGNELYVNSNYSPSVIFYLTGNFTDMLTVNKNEEYSVYYYGVKICSSEDNLEDTLILGNGSMSDLNTITVYPKKVEGV